MLFQRINRTDAEKIFIIGQNVSGSTITAGYTAVYDVSAADGVRVTKAAAARLQAFAGIADDDIANGSYGRLQVYGYRSSAYIYSSTGSSAAGDALNVIANWGLTPVAGVGTQKNFAFLASAISSSSSSVFYTTAAVFVRAL